MVETLLTLRFIIHHASFLNNLPTIEVHEFGMMSELSEAGVHTSITFVQFDMGQAQKS